MRDARAMDDPEDARDGLRCAAPLYPADGGHAESGTPCRTSTRESGRKTVATGILRNHKTRRGNRHDDTREVTR